MPEVKKEINQNKELENVNGGFGAEGYDAACKNCKKKFDVNSADHKTVGGGCDKDVVYKCPNCGKWVYANGDIYGN